MPNDAVDCLKLAELLDQHVLTDAFHQLLEVADPSETMLQVIQKLRLPRSAHQGECDIDGVTG
uniref:hypothetical protein n=1 Tax=Luteimonas sp. 4-12 TaxID=2027406 RepID=UPI001E5FD3AE|nr:MULTISPECIES: hypothetical protein [Luteimonas]